MNSRERILATLNHRQPVRIPVDLSATLSSGISAVDYQNPLLVDIVPTSKASSYMSFS